MGSEDIALNMVIHEGRECRAIVERQNFNNCPPEMKRVYLFLINSSIASLQQNNRRVFNFLGGGGIGIGLASGIEIFGRFKGWW